MSEVEGGPYTLAGQTTDKTLSLLEITGLESTTGYYFVIRTETDPHAAKPNPVISNPSNEISAMTL